LRIQTVVKRVGICSILALLVLTSKAGLAQNTSSKIALVGNIVPTLVDHTSNPSRAGDIVLLQLLKLGLVAAYVTANL
jgi:hypothetical protein